MHNHIAIAISSSYSYTFSITNMFQNPNCGSSDNGNSRHLIPDFSIFTSFHLITYLDVDGEYVGDDDESYESAHKKT